MDFLKPFRALGKKVKQKVEQYQENQEEEQLISYWKKQFQTDKSAKSDWNERFDKWEAIYNGDRAFGNVVDAKRTSQREVRTVINFPRMVVESLIDLGVPEPTFKPVARDDEEPIGELQAYVNYVTRAADPSLEAINLENERRVLKYGGAFWKVHWNNNVKRAGYIGDIEISNPHPKDIIPNKAATSMQDLEHYHHPVNHPAKKILRRWKHLTLDDLEQKATLYHEFDELGGEQRIKNNSSDEGEGGLNKYTIIETTYKDDEGDICKLWWSGDLLIKHLPKFFYPRDEQGEPSSTETLDSDVVVRAGIDEATEQPRYREVPAIQLVEVPDPETGEVVTIAQPTEIENYIPKSWDLIYQPYIPRDKCFWGISIMEDIYDLNEAIKKALYIEEETRLRGRKKLVTDNEEDKQKLLDPFSEVITARGQVKEVDFGTNYDGISWIEKLKEWMQLLTGATNAALGVKDTNVTSGKQAQIYIEQANFKVNIKTAYKASAYKQLYKVVADFALAFCDYDRPFRLGGKQTDEYGVFNRMNMLKDMSGNLIWPDYDLDVSAEAGFMKSKADVFNNIVQLANTGRFEPSPGNLTMLKLLSKLGVPMLEDVIEQMEEMLQAPPPQPDIEQILQSMPLEQREMFMQLPPEEQQAMIQQVMGGV